MNTPPGPQRDEGSILVLVLIVTVLLAIVVVGMAGYSSSIMRAGTVAELRADRLSAADGAMRDALEKLRLARSLCTTALGDASGGYGTTFPEPINGATAVVRCQRINVQIDAVQAWAVVVTGEGVVGGNTALSASQGQGEIKKISGPVFVARPADIDLAAPLKLVEGDLFYTDATCPVDGASTDLDVDELTFEPADVRGTICTKRSWRDLFGPGPTIPDLTLRPDSFPLRPEDDYTTVGECRVFSPGIYDHMPTLAAGGNYFRNGEYLFRNVPFVVNAVQTTVTVGQADSSANIAQAIPNTACDAARDADTGARGATFYLDGSSYIDVHKGALEIMGRRRGRSWVTAQALPTSNRNAENTPILSTFNGENKEFTSHGLFWAPYGRAELGNITNRSTVQLHGGAVFAKFHIGANASINNYVIEVPTSPLTQTLLLTATATKNGTTTIRAIVEYRAPREVAVVSWRIAN